MNTAHIVAAAIYGATGLFILRAFWVLSERRDPTCDRQHRDRSETTRLYHAANDLPYRADDCGYLTEAEYTSIVGNNATSTADSTADGRGVGVIGDAVHSEGSI